MEKKKPKVRLYIEADLSTSTSVQLNKQQGNYLFNVMRLNQGDLVFLIDGKSGEYIAEITKRQVRYGSLNIISKSRNLDPPVDLWLLFSPIKKLYIPDELNFFMSSEVLMPLSAIKI